MKKTNIGFGLMLLGIIFAAPGETRLWWIGVLLGLAGFAVVAISQKD